MKNLVACVFVSLVSSCGISTHNSTSALEASNGECAAAPAGDYTFVCTDSESALGDNATNFEITVKSGLLKIVNTSENAAKSALVSDQAAFAPYKNRSSNPRPDCRFQTTAPVQTGSATPRYKTIYTYKLPQTLFSGTPGKVSLYDDGGERMNSAFLNCSLKK
jgi:hypothetical protein